MRQHLANLTTCLLLCAQGFAAAAEKPNIIFIFADDWGWENLSSRGHPWLKTPNLDRLAKEGTDFQQFNVLNPYAYGYDEYAVYNGGAECPSADFHATALNAVAFIKANKSKPFFINVWLHQSHTPHVPSRASMQQWKHLDKQKQVYSAFITVREGDWKLVMPPDGTGVELHNLVSDRAEAVAEDQSKSNPQIVEHLKILAFDWKATLLKKPTPDCISRKGSGKPAPRAPGEDKD